jgi:hypothetical protein
MKNTHLEKSSFTLPKPEVLLVKRLKKELGLSSNTAVVRRALLDLQKKVEREHLRQQFQSASDLVRRVNREDMKALDLLSDEGLSEN